MILGGRGTGISGTPPNKVQTDQKMAQGLTVRDVNMVQSYHIKS
jgi:hypothetical protein